jgi:hypothetical protein
MFKEKIKEIFGYEVEEYTEHPSRNEVTFELRRTEFDAEKLFALSDALGTGTIGIETQTRWEGNCDTCSYEYGVMILIVRGVKF